MRRIKIALIAMIIIPFVVYGLNEFNFFEFDGANRTTRCKRQTYVLEQRLKGYVIDKYINEKNHNAKTLVIKNNLGKQQVTTILATEVSGLYSRIQIGDFLRKDKGELKVYIESDTTNYTRMLDFNCSSG